MKKYNTVATVASMDATTIALLAETAKWAEQMRLPDALWHTTELFEMLQIAGDPIISGLKQARQWGLLAEEFEALREKLRQYHGSYSREDARQQWTGEDNPDAPAQRIISGRVYARKPSGRTLASWQTTATYTTGRGRAVLAYYVVEVPGRGQSVYRYNPARDELTETVYCGRAIQ